MVAMGTSTVGIVADDLTGANDTAALFAAAGWPQVSSHLDVATVDRFRPGRAGVVALCTGARALDPATAARVTEAGVRRLLWAGAERVFVKIDSTMRGSVAAQVAAALRAWRSAHGTVLGVLCPAHPGQGRTVWSGRLLVRGTEVAATPYAVGLAIRSSRLADLVPGTVCLPVPTGQPAELAAGLRAAAARGSGVVVVDASSMAALRTVAVAVTQLGTGALPIGSGGLGGVLASVWRGDGVAPELSGGDLELPGRDPKLSGGGADRPVAAPSSGARCGTVTAGRVVVVSASRSNVTLAQLKRLRTWYPGTVWIQPSPADLLCPVAAERWRARVSGGEVVLVSVARSPASGRVADAGAVAAGLGALAADVLRDEPVRALVSVGGDGTAAVLRACGASGVRLTGWLPSGVALGVVEGGALAGLPVATKAGGFGTPGTLVATVRHLTAAGSPP